MVAVKTPPQPLRLEAALSGMLALMVAAREEMDGVPRRKTEGVLAEAGLSNEEIGQLVGKTADAVRKVIERERKGKG